MLAISLLHRIRKDARKIGLPIDDVDLVVYKRYCCTYYGRYYSPLITKGRPKIKLYPYENYNKDMYDYSLIFSVVVHEMIHHIQYSSEDFVRHSNIMHDPDFWNKYNLYMNKARKLKIISEDFEGV